MNRSLPTTDVFAPAAQSLQGDKTGRQSVLVKRAIPGHSKHVDEIYKLYCELQETGQRVDPDEFCLRYPEIQDSLTRVIRVHCFFEAHCETDDPDEQIDWPRPGDFFAGFHLDQELGRGAIARVYQATEPALGGRRVVVKISRNGHAEAATLGRSAHPNIVPVHSVVCEEISGLTGVCMPYLGPATLSDVLDHAYGGPQLPDKAAAILEASADPGSTNQVIAPSVLRKGNFVDGVRFLAVQLVDALTFIHANGIFHHDLKPSNILVRPDGTPMLLDFNLAADAQQVQRRDGGTPFYMSPERLRALAEDNTAPGLDARSDLYSLGVILYELVTGKHPFGPLPIKTTGLALIQFLLERQQQPIRPIRTIRPGVDAPLASAIEWCLLPDPACRPASAADLAVRLRRTQGARARIERWLVRRRKMVAAFFAMFLTFSAAAAYHLAMRPPEHTTQAQRGDEALARRDPGLAVNHYSASLFSSPRQPEVLLARGKAYLQLAQAEPEYYALANTDFDQAHKLLPSAWTSVHIGYGYHRQNEYKSAIYWYEKALQLGMATAALYNNLGHAYCQCGKPNDVEAARVHLERALVRNPKFAAAHYNMAVVYYRKALAAKSLSAAQKARTPDLAREAEFLKSGIAEFREAAALGPVTGDMAFVGAALCARASHHDESFLAPALEYLGMAIDLGMDPGQFKKRDLQVMVLANRRAAAFQTLLARTPPVNHPSLEAVRIADLVKE